MRQFRLHAGQVGWVLVCSTEKDETVEHNDINTDPDAAGDGEDRQCSVQHGRPRDYEVNIHGDWSLSQENCGI